MDYVRNMTYEQYNAALKERDAEIERLRALLKEAEGPVVHHATDGCIMCIEFMPQLQAALYPNKP